MHSQVLESDAVGNSPDSNNNNRHLDWRNRHTALIDDTEPFGDGSAQLKQIQNADEDCVADVSRSLFCSFLCKFDN
jgi:hypothetical protein